MGVSMRVKFVARAMSLRATWGVWIMRYPAVIGALISTIALLFLRFYPSKKRLDSSNPSDISIRAATSKKGGPGKIFAHNSEVAVKLLISMCILAFSMYLIVWFNTDKETKNWAFGMIGLIVGFWINQKS